MKSVSAVRHALHEKRLVGVQKSYVNIATKPDLQLDFFSLGICVRKNVHFYRSLWTQAENLLAVPFWMTAMKNEMIV